MNKEKIFYLVIMSFLFSNVCLATEKMEEKSSDVEYRKVIIGDNTGFLRLKSGEILVGDFEGTVKEDSNYSYDQVIDFDSDDLGDQEIDVEDIAEMQTKDKFRVRLINGKIYSGHLKLKGGNLTIIEENKSKTVPINQVVAINAFTQNEFEHWTSDLFLGADISSGNTEELSVSGEFNAERRTVSSRTKLNYSVYVAESSGEKTATSHDAEGSYDIYLRNQLFVRPVKLSISSDKFQNIDYSINYAMQLGYLVVSNSDTEWDVSLGPGYQYTKYDTVLEGDSQTEDSPTVLFSSNFEYDITDDLEFTYNYDMNLADSDSGGVTYKNDFGLDLEVVEDLDFSVKLAWDHVSEPKADSDGITPEKDDYKLHFGLTYDF